MKIFKSIISLTLLLCGFSSATAVTYKGDLNGDGKVDMADMAEWSRYKASATGSIDSKYDLNNNEKLDDSDLEIIANLIINMKLTENSGVNVGIGGWDDDGKDYGGTVGGAVNLVASRAAEDFRLEAGRLYFDNDNGYIVRSMNVYEGSSIAGLLVDIRLSWGVTINPESIKLSPERIKDHRVYGTPVITSRENDDTKHFRFIIYSPSLAKFNGDGELFSFSYQKEPESWDDSMKLWDCQAISGANSEASYFSTDTGNWDFTLLESISFEEEVPAEGIVMEAGEKKHLGLTFNPDNASYKEVVCTSSNEAVAIFNKATREVEALSGGEAIITVSALDGSGLSCSAKIIVKKDEIMGDVNGDKRINISDVVALVNHISALNPDNFIVEVADVNGDEKINISDVVALVNMISNH